jgi:mutator family transposase
VLEAVRLIRTVAAASLAARPALRCGGTCPGGDRRLGPRPCRTRRWNSRNGTRTKTVLTEIGPVQIEAPRNHDASFDPVIVRKRQRRLDGIDEIVLSLTAATCHGGDRRALRRGLRRQGR